jgi:hypothetical protein
VSESSPRSAFVQRFLPWVLLAIAAIFSMDRFNPEPARQNYSLRPREREQRHQQQNQKAGAVPTTCRMAAEDLRRARPTTPTRRP